MDITSWLVHTCTKKSRTSTGSKGDATYGSATTFKARVEKSNAGVRSSSGKENLHQYVLMTNTLVLIDDVIWFPAVVGEAADDTSKISAGRTPSRIEAVTDKQGVTKLWQVYFGG